MNSRRTFLRTSATASAALLGGIAFAADGHPIPGPSKDFWNVIAGRRSVRKFKSDPVPEVDLTRILDAARLAPTSGNQQPWKFLVIRDRAKIDQMKEACVQRVLGFYDQRTDNTATREETEKAARGRFDDYFSAPVYLVVLTDGQSQYPDYNHWDGPLAAGYLMLAARALGYGTVFITDVIPDEVTKKVLAIPDRYTRVCITPLGVPVEWPESPPKRKLDAFIAYETL
ncbi:MAG: nitroreductase family protein [Opitutaceae bacterium]|nr:nitroreductase family protein [Opitutaceae bacterium]